MLLFALWPLLERARRLRRFYQLPARFDFAAENASRRAHVTELEASHPDLAIWQGTLAVLEQTLKYSQKRPWVILDGYHFDREYHKQLRAA